MKKRSEVAGLKKRSEAKPEPSSPPGFVHCSGCDEQIGVAEITSFLDDKSGECPKCGDKIARAKIEAADPEGNDAVVDETGDAGTRRELEEKAKPEADGSSPAPAMPNPEAKWCGTCGSEWPIVKGQFFINCGHMMASRIDDPRKATKYGPPSPLGVRVDHEVAKRNAEDAAHARSSHEKTIAPEAAPPAKTRHLPEGAVVSGNRLSIPWGEARMPIDQWNNFKCGGFIVTVDLPPDADRVKAAEGILSDLEKIADIAFERQKKWYLKKLDALSGK